MKGNTIFDNVIITDDVAEADKFLAKWKALSEVEKAKKKEDLGKGRSGKVSKLGLPTDPFWVPYNHFYYLILRLCKPNCEP